MYRNMRRLCLYAGRTCIHDFACELLRTGRFYQIAGNMQCKCIHSVFTAFRKKYNFHLRPLKLYFLCQCQAIQPRHIDRKQRQICMIILVFQPFEHFLLLCESLNAFHLCKFQAHFRCLFQNLFIIFYI